MICSAVCCCGEEKDTTVGTSTNCSAVCGAVSTLRERRDDDEILGISITFSGNGVSRCKTSHLRHRNVQNLKHGHDVDELLHGAQLDPFPWSQRLTQTRWPGTAGLFLKQLEEHRLGGGLSQNFAVSYIS